MSRYKRYSPLLAFLIIVAATVIYVAASASPQPGGDLVLSHARSGHVATVLPDGRVLVTGGSGGKDAVAESEVFDLRTRTIYPAGFASPRTRHTATVIDDTRVLIAGGEEGGVAVDTTQIFDGRDDAAASGPPMTVPRAGHTATALADGRIVLIGGDEKGSIEIFDGQSFVASAATLVYPRSSHSAIRLANGTVLVVGGVDANGDRIGFAEIYDPVTDTVSPGGVLRGLRVQPDLRLLPDGKVQVIGGDDEATMEMYNANGRYFTARAHLLKVPEEKLLKSAGRSVAIASEALRAAKFQTNGAFTVAKGFSISEIPDSNMAVRIGGADRNGNATSSVVLYDSSNATITTDKTDYPPGQTVTISGAGWLPGETVTIEIVADGQPDVRSPLYAVADANGNFTNTQFQTTTADLNVTFILTATGGTSGYTATTTFTDANPSANLDQCANGASTPQGMTCEWVNGNVGSSKALYMEGDSLPYRLTFANLALSTHHVTIEWDTTKGGKHALDYLTTYNRTITSANPCDGVSGCTGSGATYAIPKDGQVDNGSGSPITQLAGNFTMWGGTITGVGVSPYYTYPDGSGFAGDKSAQITIYFTATVANPVLSWSAHIATRQDWGMENSAVSISGSPYHTSLVDLDGSGGAQDRSLAAAAVLFPGSITIIKDATPNGSKSFSFTASPSPLANFSLVDDGTTANTQLFSNITNFQAYTIAETVPSGWSLTGITCTVTAANGGSYSISSPTVTIDLKEGENYTCTYADQQQKAYLYVIKHVVNDNGGTAVAADFAMSVTGTNPSPSSFAGVESPGTYVTLDPGSYSVSETGVTGYAATYSTDCTGSLTAGQTKTCTVTNNDVAPQLTVIKHVINDNGGTKVASDFTMNVTGTNVSSSSFAGAESPGTTVTLNAGSYSVAEPAVSGYTTTYSTDCTGSIAVGATKTCTVTNNDQAATLTVIKHVINDNGGTKVASDFTINVTGQSPSPASFSGAESPGTSVSLNAGSYSVAEPAVSGYTTTYSTDCTGSITNGQSKTCTVTNNDDPAHLIVIKHVINDNGGTKVASDFTINVTGSSPSPASFSGAESPGTDVTINAGAYSVAEPAVTGYTTTYSTDCTGSLVNGQTKTCTVTNNDQAATLIVIKNVINDNGGTKVASDFTINVTGNSPSPASFPGAVSPGTSVTINAGAYSVAEPAVSGYTTTYSTDCTGSLANGETKTCTVTNNDQAATLIVIKNVINDNGGTKVASDFTINVTGNSPSPASFAGAASPGTSVTINAGAYSVAEPAVTGYTTTYSTDCTGSLANGQTKTCTVTNDDQAATLIVIKHVINDNGGTKVASDFTINVTGQSPSPASFSGAESPGTNVTINAGSYSVAEPAVTGYTTTYSTDCTGSIANGETKTCTVTNDDNTAHLQLVKSVTNDNGGTAVAADWTLYAAGPTNISGAGGVSSDVSAGLYTLTESAGPSGYSAGTWSCVGGTQSGATVTLALGESAVCTIVNNDVAPSLTLVKYVVNDNGGLALPAAWTLTATGPTTLSGAGGAVSGATFSAGSYALSETAGPAGYSASAWSCTGGGTLVGSTLTIGLAETVTCSITNDDQPPYLELIKQVINDNDGTAVATDWTLTATGPTPLSGTTPVQSGASFAAGTYALSETGPAGYIASAWSCTGTGTLVGSNITVGLGQSAVCTITNNDQPSQSFFTNSSLCLIPGNQFRNLFLPDMQTASFRLNATNPGQFYYNAIFYGTAGDPVSIDLEIPYPFVTQGATPIHAYSGVRFDGSCLTPIGDITSGFTTTAGAMTSPAGNPIIVLSDYSPQNIGSTVHATIAGTMPSSGLLYVNIHLDYGLKRTTGWSGNSNGDATNGGVTIDNPQTYEFDFSADGNLIDTDSPTSINIFKKPVGFFGLLSTLSTGDPLSGVSVTLKNEYGVTVGSARTDANGFYLIGYKHTGPAASYTVRAALLPAQSKSLTVKANGYGIASFVDPNR